jgi:predicted GNAT family N-acyltransferase
MNRATRRALAKKDTADKVLKECLAAQHKTISNTAVNATAVMMFNVLYDKFGFGKTRLKRLWDELNNMSECVNSGMVSIKDLEKILSEELDVHFTEGGAGA